MGRSSRAYGRAGDWATASPDRWWRACRRREMPCRPASGWRRDDGSGLAKRSGACLALSPIAAYVASGDWVAGWRRAIVGNNYDIILIGLVAIFLILRLRAVLGKRTGNERPPARDPFSPPTPPPSAGQP